MFTAIAWIGAQVTGTEPAFGWLYVWTMFADFMLLAFIHRSIRAREAAIQFQMHCAGFQPGSSQQRKRGAHPANDEA